VSLLGGCSITSNVEAAGYLLTWGRGLDEKKKAGKYSSVGGENSKICAAIRPKSQANGSSTTVDFTEKAFNSCYTPGFLPYRGPGKAFDHRPVRAGFDVQTS